VLPRAVKAAINMAVKIASHACGDDHVHASPYHLENDPVRSYI
jgi:hypothetical protein